MKQSLICGVLIASWLLPAQAFAQGVDMGLSGVGLLSLQPIDDAYVGSPYLSEGIGGGAPGFGAGLNATFPGGLVVAGEYSTARFEQEQYGRLVGGGSRNDGVPHTTRLQDSLLSGLLGYARSAGNTRLQLLGGVALKLDNPTINGTPRERFEAEGGEPGPLALIGGVDLLQSLTPRASLVIAARYTIIDRPENHRYLGIGSQVLRLAAGIRVRLN